MIYIVQEEIQTRAMGYSRVLLLAHVRGHLNEKAVLVEQLFLAKRVYWETMTLHMLTFRMDACLVLQVGDCVYGSDESAHQPHSTAARLRSGRGPNSFALSFGWNK